MEGAVVPIDAPSRHVLLVGSQERRDALRAQMNGARWELAEADSLPQAQFVLQLHRCDLVVLDSVLAGPGWSEALTALAREVPAPVVLVGDAETAVVVAALNQGALWLNDATFHEPAVLTALLDQAARLGEGRRQAAADRMALQESQERIDRLLGLLWDATPGEGPTRWFTQRYMLERLDEELARSQRYGAPLSIVLGEVRTEPGEQLRPEQANRLARWLAECIGKGKRRCDVAGQYGLHGFMLLLPQSSSAQAQEACKRMRGLLADPPHDDLPRIHACFGLASVSSGAATVQGVLRRAEESLEHEMSESGY
jgi:GGDEF domain-containing protein